MITGKNAELYFGESVYKQMNIEVVGTGIVIDNSMREQDTFTLCVIVQNLNLAHAFQIRFRSLAERFRHQSKGRDCILLRFWKEMKTIRLNMVHILFIQTFQHPTGQSGRLQLMMPCMTSSMRM